MTRSTLMLIFASSLIVLVSVTTGYLIITEPAEAGHVASIEATLSKPAAAGSPTPTRQPIENGDSMIARPSVPIVTGLLADQPAARPLVPVALRLRSIDVDALIVPTGVDRRTGQMAVPDNVRDVAWYEFGPRPGESGSAVLAAHVDLAGQGPGVFFHLREVDPGDIVEIEFSDGTTELFRAGARAIYQKEELPLETVFSKGGSPVLTMITCGGGFSESSGSYDSNIVVYAVPVADRDLASIR
jgi:hypothetical protein